MSLLPALEPLVRGLRSPSVHRRARRAVDRRVRPGLEALERLALLDSGAASVVSALASTDPTEQTQTYTASLPYTPTNFRTGTTPGVAPLSIPQFDPSLGTLTSVDLTFSGSIRDAVQVESHDTLPSVINPTLEGTVSMTLDDTSFQPLQIKRALPPFDAASYDGTQDYAGPSGQTYPETSQSKSESQTLQASSSNLSAFIGTGNIQANVAATGQSVITGPANLMAHTETQASATVTVVYHYTPSSVGGQQIMPPPPTPPAPPAPCPPATITGIARYGVHRQNVAVQVTFSQALDPTQARNPANYRLMSSGPDFQFGTFDDQAVPIQSVVYHPATHSAVLYVRGGANVHRLYQLSVTSMVPCGTTSQNSVLFDRASLSGFVSHRDNSLVPLRHPLPSNPLTAVGPNQYAMLSPRTQALLAWRQRMELRSERMAVMVQAMRAGHHPG